jgi:Lar family restriction alleviation protein
MKNLKPCPFCGGKRPQLFVSKPEICGDAIWYAIQCSRQKCGAFGPMFGRYAELPDGQEELAAAAWNSRVSLTPQIG